MTVQVEYEPVNPLTNKMTLEQYLSAAPTRFSRRDGTIFAFANLYADSLRILTDRIREFYAKLIRDKSGRRLSRILQFTLKMVKYAPLENRGLQPLPKFLSKRKDFINIQNYDERCFGYAFLYIFERANLLEQYCCRATLYNDNIFHRHRLDTLQYFISTNDVHLYEDLIQMNINVFSFFDDEGRA